VTPGLQIDSRFVGTPLKPYATQLHWRDATNFAAAVGDANPRYFDDTAPEGIVAAPVAAVAVTWPITEKMGDYIAAADFPRDLLITQVHYDEHLAFHRMLKPLDRLTIEGRIAAIVPHRSGTRVTVCYRAIDPSGLPVFTEHIGALLRGVACTDPGKGGEALPAVPSVQNKGTSLWDAVLPIDSLLPYIYDGCSRIHFPIDTSPRFARAVGLDGTIVQGTALLALVARELVNREGEGRPERLAELYCRFGAMVRPGTSVRLCLRAARDRSDGGRDLSFELLTADGRPAIRGGHARLRSGIG